MLDLKLAERPSRFAVQFNQKTWSDAVGSVLLLPCGQYWSDDMNSRRRPALGDANLALAHWLETGCLPGYPAGPLTEPSRALAFWMGGTSEKCAFRPMVQWLESIMTADHPLSIYWDSEGPSGDMTWFPETAGVGVLEINWSRWHHRYFVRTERRNLVTSFYQSFRALVESEHYNPTWYEHMTLGRRLGYWLADANAKDVIGAIVAMDRRNVILLMDAVYESLFESNILWGIAGACLWPGSCARRACAKTRHGCR